MMFLAKKRLSAPKDLGLDLLVLKDKKNYRRNNTINLLRRLLKL
jgi:hypothetical protein